MKKARWMIALCLAGVALSVAAPSATPPAKADWPMVSWEALLPPSQRNAANSDPPAPVHDYLEEGGVAATQNGSFDVNPKLDRSPVRIPGFVVPLDNLPNNQVREFFLVPYFGACIHVPPPPPNQIVYVKLTAPVKVGSMYDAVWVSGTMHTEGKSSRLGASAYTLDAVKVEPYQ